MTISYGHGICTSPLHLAAAYATIANGGRAVAPTLLKQRQPQLGTRVISETTAAAARSMLRKVVTEGTASLGDVPGYAVGGKTGTADKPREKGGGYYKDKVIATFATIFPAHTSEIRAYRDARRAVGKHAATSRAAPPDGRPFPSPPN